MVADSIRKRALRHEYLPETAVVHHQRPFRAVQEAQRTLGDLPGPPALG